MKIKSLQISNILSFKYYENIEDATEILFDDGVNILIGQNGSGKSTALEIINFLFKRVLFLHFDFNQNFYSKRNELEKEKIKQILVRHNTANSSYEGFRLDPNWDSEGRTQKIKFEVVLDAVDKSNLNLLTTHKAKLATVARKYSSESVVDLTSIQDNFIIEVELDKSNKNFKINSTISDPGFTYLVMYNFYKQIIYLHNLENSDDLIPTLNESFALIGCYRNYHSFTPSVSLGGAMALQQIQGIGNTEYSKSTNAAEVAEPPIFNLVRLRVADKHYNQYGIIGAIEADKLANQEGFLLSINEKLKLVNLKVEIKLKNQQKWEYSFSFFDTKREKILADINSLSSGQKAIIHLVFEAYGRGELKGGLVIIDEPEIHLHYQFQNEYLRIIEEINKEQKCQYIIVTHSESLINSETISHVKRLGLDDNNYTYLKSPVVSEDQKTLIKILDNTRSTYAFFAKKVVLVEGDTDRYFFRAVFEELNKDAKQEIAILDIGGKGNYDKWKDFFESFGLGVYYIGDFDNIFSLKFSEETIINPLEREVIENELKQNKLNNLSSDQKGGFKSAYDELILNPSFLIEPKRAQWKLLIDMFINFVKLTSKDRTEKVRENFTDIDQKIEEKYQEKVYILKQGSIEDYSKTKHGDLNNIIDFCSNDLSVWLKSNTTESKEITFIVNEIAK